MSKNIETIQVFGTGCPTCKRLFETTKQVVAELGMEVEVEYIDDIEKLLAFGLMSSPVLAVNNHAVAAGQLPSAEKIRELLLSEQASVPMPAAGCCDCGGKY